MQRANLSKVRPPSNTPMAVLENVVGITTNDTCVKDARIPSVSGGVLWPDTANRLFYLFAGEYASVSALRETSPQDFTLYFYDTIYNTWNRSVSDASQASIAWPAFGAGAVTDTGTAYYYGGYLTEKSDAGWRGGDLMLNGMLSYDMGTRRWGNNTWDQTRRAEGSLVYIPASEGGMLVYFGGVEMESLGGEIVYVSGGVLWVMRV